MASIYNEEIKFGKFGAVLKDRRDNVFAHQAFKHRQGEFDKLDLEEKFNLIHTTNLWGAERSVSGLGSEPEVITPFLPQLIDLFKEYSISSIVDAPCGDGSWIDPAIDAIKKYHGIDIVQKLVDHLQQAHLRDEKRTYLKRNFVVEAVPRADVIFCRDALVHLSYTNIHAALQRFKRSGAKWLLTTHFTQTELNIDIEDGDWRPLNFLKPPFIWPKPQFVLFEGCVEADGAFSDKSLALWELSNILTN